MEKEELTGSILCVKTEDEIDSFFLSHSPLFEVIYGDAIEKHGACIPTFFKPLTKKQYDVIEAGLKSTNQKQ